MQVEFSQQCVLDDAPDGAPPAQKSAGKETSMEPAKRKTVSDSPCPPRVQWYAPGIPVGEPEKR